MSKPEEEEDDDFPLDRPSSGARSLGVLAKPRAIALMRVARDQWRSSAQLAECAGYGAEATRSLRRMLERRGLLERRPDPQDARRRQWRLSPSGHDLLEIAVEQEKLASLLPLRDAPELVAKALSDPWNRSILRQLLSKPVRFGSLLRLLHSATPAGRTHELDGKALSMRLTRLESLRLVKREPYGNQSTALYAPGEHLWRLARMSVLLARWHWIWTANDAPRLVGDLLGLVQMIAERVRLPEDSSDGIVVLHVEAPPDVERWRDAVVAVNDSRALMLGMNLANPDARVRAPPLAWCEALLSGNYDLLQVDGDQALASTLLDGLVAIVRRG